MIKQDLINITASIKADFSQDELAYLVLTTKAEGVLRDAIAYRMHISPELQKDHLVCREVNIGPHSTIRIDLAVIDPAINPEILIELKAHNSIDPPDFLWPKNKNEMARDILKMYYAANDDTDIYFIFFNNVPNTTVWPSYPPNLNKSVKYCDSRHVLYNISKSYRAKVIEVFDNWIHLLNLLNLPIELTSVVEINAGSYYKIPVSVFAFIYGPFKKGQVKTKPGNTYQELNLGGIDVDQNGLEDMIYIFEDETLDDLSLTKKNNSIASLTNIPKSVPPAGPVGPPRINQPATKRIDHFTGDLNLFERDDRVEFIFKGNLLIGTIKKIYKHLTPFQNIEVGDQLAKINGPNTPHTTGIYCIGLEDIIRRI